MKELILTIVNIFAFITAMQVVLYIVEILARIFSSNKKKK
uniref:Uncharacterized protein n=1 Tax=Podoviridae sp. ctQyH19 TaxID=2825249 RepID=A0A8S5UQQ9_9CAUD|nr:MAG TPA: hypothetical protein [Podoviridae sp. ctQyH19]